MRFNFNETLVGINREFMAEPRELIGRQIPGEAAGIWGIGNLSPDGAVIGAVKNINRAGYAVTVPFYFVSAAACPDLAAFGLCYNYHPGIKLVGANINAGAHQAGLTIHIHITGVICERIVAGFDAG
jgi:hypothetical protein